MSLSAGEVEDVDTEASLIRLAQQGNGEAFQTLLHSHLPKIHSYAHRVLGNPNDASDVAQEVFTRFWLKSKSFNPDKARLGTWLHQIAHNLCMDHFRKHGKLVSEFEQENEAQEDECTSPESTMEQVETQHRVKQALSRLPERQRSAIVLCHYQGFSNKQAADILKLSTEALESLLSRARRALKAELLESRYEAN